MRLTKFAGDSDVLVTVTSSVYGSPALTISGCVKVSVKRGLRTFTMPAARPWIGTGPTGSPSSVAAIVISTTWLPSRRPSTRNSALPVSPGAIVVMSSAVPSAPSGPACVMALMRGVSPAVVRAIASGSSGVPATSSFPVGSRIVAERSRTTRFDPAGATLPTMSSTLKNWLRNPMSPGITMTPGMGGTTSCWPCGVLGGCRVKPTTLRLGTCVWMRSVSGMIVFRSCSCACVDMLPSVAVGSSASAGPRSVGSTTGNEIGIAGPSATANAAVKL